MEEQEDCNAFAADCIVVSCCCQCLALQIVILVLVRLPYKLVTKTKELARKRLRKRRKCGFRMKGSVEDYMERRCEEEFEWTILDGMAVEFGDGEECVKEVERVLEELVERGEFGFGSFWGRGRRSGCGQHEFDFTNVVQNFHLIEISVVPNKT